VKRVLGFAPDTSNSSMGVPAVTSGRGLCPSWTSCGGAHLPPTSIFVLASAADALPGFYFLGSILFWLRLCALGSWAARGLVGRAWWFGIAPAAGLLGALVAVPCCACTALGSSAARGFGDCATSLLGVQWAISRRRRNWAMHALHGNGPPGTGAQGWATVGRRAPGVQLARELQDL
jgi:hypothetical protein